MVGNQANVVGNKSKDEAEKNSAVDTSAFGPGQNGYDNADPGHLRGAQPGEEHGKDDSSRGRFGSRSENANTDSDSDFI